MPEIQLQSFQSLFLKFYYEDQYLACGTGFMANTPGGPVLVTARHCVTGRDQETNQPISNHGGVPNRVVVCYTVQPTNGDIEWAEASYFLHGEDQDDRYWHEHPSYGAAYDFVALPVGLTPNLLINAYDLQPPPDPILLRPAETVSIIGFPLGRSAGFRFGIWSTGFLASEPLVPYDNKPLLLVDCRTKRGQSGSPVVAVRSGVVKLESGATVDVGQRAVQFVGLYSGRVSEGSDIGIVWKASAIQELLSTNTAWGG